LNDKNECVGVAFRKRVDRGSENIGCAGPVIDEDDAVWLP
jgi:hypothetical protein